MWIMDSLLQASIFIDVQSVVTGSSIIKVNMNIAR